MPAWADAPPPPQEEKPAASAAPAIGAASAWNATAGSWEERHCAPWFQARLDALARDLTCAVPDYGRLTVEARAAAGNSPRLLTRRAA